MKFHWSAGFVLGEVVSYHRNGNDFFGLIKNFFLNEEVNGDFNTMDLFIIIIVLSF